MLSKILSFLIKLLLMPVRLLSHGIGKIFMYLGDELEKVEVGLTLVSPIPVVATVASTVVSSTPTVPTVVGTVYTSGGTGFGPTGPVSPQQ